MATGVDVATIDSFQGREADSVIISMVRSNNLGSVGFLGDKRRMNVAITSFWEFGLCMDPMLPTTS
ncbi:hypothetical protein P3S68_007141 [Capsicum galapagoense]